MEIKDKGKLLLTFYLASAIENNPNIQEGEAQEDKEKWKKEIKEILIHPLVGIYDPVEREAMKTGKPSNQTCEYIKNLKRAGHWDLFHGELDKIWWGMIKPLYDKIEIMKLLRYKFLIEGNTHEDLNFWGDIEAVIRSNFVLAYMEKDVKTVGTIREITYAEMFNIPIYLVLPDQSKTDANSTLVDMVKKSGGEIFYSIKDCIKFIKDTYPIGWLEKK